MNAGDTSLGGGARNFPNTTWGMLSRLQDASGRQAGLEELSRRYWKPVYRYLRVAWSRSNDDAKDTTQAFFLWLSEGEALLRYRAERGGFRTYLKLLLNGFVSNELKAAGRLKRGGGGRVLSLDEAAIAAADAADPGQTDPERAFDRAWVRQLVEEAVNRVRKRCEEADRATSFRIYEEYTLGTAEPRPTYAALAARHGVSVGSVEARLESMRDEVRAEVRAELARLTDNDEDLRSEWNGLFGRD